MGVNLRESRFAVDMRQLPGGQSCLFQVAASQRVRTSVARTEAVARPPQSAQAYIIRPARGTRFTAGAPVTFVGGGFSPDFGTSDFDDVVWSSNRDGEIGVGYQVITRALRPGRHRITLAVSDGMGGEATASTTVVVEEGSSAPLR
jgi:hypothetical protein